MRSRQTHFARPANRAGFTLTEMLVVVAILLILAGMTIAVFNSVTASDRIRSGARQVQSALLGARDRAIFAQKVAVAGDSLSRGLRLVVEPGTTATRRVVRQMVFIQETEPALFGPAQAVSVELRRIDLDGDSNLDLNPFETSDPIHVLREKPILPATSSNEFQRLKDEGFLKEGMQVEITAGGTSEFYTIQFNNPYPGAQNGTGATRADELYLVTPFQTTASTPQAVVAFTDTETNARIELPPQPLVGEQPLQLPVGIAIDIGADGVLSRNDLPLAGWTSDFGAYDILFNARGGVIGRLGASGIVSFLLCDLRDLDEGLNPASPTSRGDWLAVSLFTQSGLVLTSPVDITDAFNNSTGASGADGLTDNPFAFARMGEAAAR